MPTTLFNTSPSCFDFCIIFLSPSWLDLRSHHVRFNALLGRPVMLIYWFASLNSCLYISLSLHIVFLCHNGFVCVWTELGLGSSVGIGRTWQGWWEFCDIVIALFIIPSCLFRCLCRPTEMAPRPKVTACERGRGSLIKKSERDVFSFVASMLFFFISALFIR